MDRVVYFSQGGNTKRLADAIAKGAGVTPISVDQVSEFNDTNILFVGASIYKGKIDGKVREFLRRIRPSQVKVVVVFGTSAGKKTALAEVRSILKGQNIPLHDEIFHCSGSFLFFNRGRRYLKLTQICSFLLKSDVQFLLHRVANARTLHRLTPCNSRH